MFGGDRARVFLAAGALAPVLFIVTFLIDGATRPGYRPWRNMVSQLATGERGWMQIANFLVCGALIAASSIGLRRAGMSRAASVAVAAIGIGMVLAGVFVTDPGLGYPPGALVESEPSLHDTIHGLVSLVVFLALGLAPVLVALSMRRSSPAWSVYSALSAVLTLAFFAASVYGSVAGDRTTPIGIYQRISIIAGLGWLSALCSYLLGRPSRRGVGASA